MTIQLSVVETPGDDDRRAIHDVLSAHNTAVIGPSDEQHVAILLKAEDGASVGGLWARTAYGWMFVNFLAVPAALRGQDLGTRLLQAAEEVAKQRGCRAIWLDTFSFQARGFYEKLGYTVFGTLDDYPVGHQRFFLTKRI